MYEYERQYNTLTKHFTKYHRVMNGSSDLQPTNQHTVWHQLCHIKIVTTPHHTKNPKHCTESASYGKSCKSQSQKLTWNIVKHVRVRVRVNVCPRDENYVKYSLETKIVYNIFVIARHTHKCTNKHKHINRMNMTYNYKYPEYKSLLFYQHK